MQPFTPVSSSKLYIQIYNQLHTAIKSGQYAVGEKLPSEKDLCTMFNVSRVPVREALCALELNGLVDSMQGAGYYVKEATPIDAELMHEVEPQEIIRARQEHGAPGDIFRFIDNLDVSLVNKKAMESLIKAGALDSLNPNRAAHLAVYEQLMTARQNDARKNIAGQISLFQISSAEMNEADTTGKLPDVKNFDSRILLGLEKEMLGIYISGHPLDEYADKIRRYATVSSRDLAATVRPETEEDGSIAEGGFEGGDRTGKRLWDGKVVTMGGMIEGKKNLITKNNKMMAFVDLEDLEGVTEVIVFPNVYDRCRDVLFEDSVIAVRGKLNFKEGEVPKLLADNIVPLEEAEDVKDETAATAETVEVEKKETVVEAEAAEAAKEVTEEEKPLPPAKVSPSKYPKPKREYKSKLAKAVLGDRNSRVLAAALLMMAIFAGYQAWDYLVPKTVSLIYTTYDGMTKAEYATKARTAGEVLAELTDGAAPEGGDIRVGENDLMNTPEEIPIANGTKIDILKATKVKAKIAGKTSDLWLVPGTVEDNLKLNAVAFDEDDEIKPALDKKISEKTKITVNEVHYKVKEKTEKVEAVDKVILDPSMTSGVQDVEEGNDGEGVFTYTTKYVNGKKKGTEKDVKEWITEPHDNVLRLGTSATGNSGEYVVTKTFTANTTAYTAGSGARGALGQSVHVGIWDQEASV